MRTGLIVGIFVGMGLLLTAAVNLTETPKQEVGFYDDVVTAKGPIVNVLAYGAVGDGIIDDTVAIQAAADAISSGDTLLMPKGTYAISDTIHFGRWMVDDSNNVTGWIGNTNGIRIVGGGDQKSQTSRIVWIGDAQTGDSKTTYTDSVGSYDIITNAKPMFSMIACTSVHLEGLELDGDGKAFSCLEFDGNYDMVTAINCEFRESFIGVRNTIRWDSVGGAIYYGYGGSDYFVANVYDMPSAGGFMSNNHAYISCTFEGNTINFSNESSQALSIEFINCGFVGSSAAEHWLNAGGRMDFYGCWDGGTATYAGWNPFGGCQMTFFDHHTETSGTTQWFQSTTTSGTGPKIAVIGGDVGSVCISSGGARISAVNAIMGQIIRAVDKDQEFYVSLQNVELPSISLITSSYDAKIHVTGSNIKVTGGGNLLQGTGAYECEHWITNVYPATAYPFLPSINSSGFLGLGTSDPNSILDIEGTITTDQIFSDVNSVSSSYMSPNLSVGLYLPDPNSYWTMDDNAANTTVLDSGSYGHDLTSVVNTDSMSSIGMVNTSLAFNGSSDYAIRSGRTLCGTSGTIVAWINVDTIGASDQWIIASADEATVGVYRVGLKIGASNGYLFYEQKNNDTADTLAYLTRVSVGEWHHVAMTSDGDNIALYYDGYPCTLVTLTGANNGDWFGDTSNRDNITVGVMKYNSIVGYFNGVIDDIRVFDSCLSAATIWYMNAFPSEQFQGRATITGQLGLKTGSNKVSLVAGSFSSDVIATFPETTGIVGVWLSGSATWDPASLDDGVGETSAGITVTGAALGDFVIASAPYDLQDMTVTAYVQATNTVEIRLQNESGSTINLDSGTWKVKVMKQ